MNRFSFTGRSYESLLEIARTASADERRSVAVLLGVISEVEAHEYYKAAGYASMHAWCAGELGLRDQRAFKRIAAAGHARRFPAILAMVSDGRLCMTAVNLLGPHLNEENAERLLAAAADKSKFEIEVLIAELQQPTLQPTDEGKTENELSPEIVNFSDAKPNASVESAAPQVAAQAVDLRVPFRAAMRRTTHEKLAYVRALLG